MGVQTLQEFRDELDGGLQRSNIPIPLKDKWVNQALKEIGYAFKFHELEESTSFDTVASQAEYVIGSGQAISVVNLRAIEEIRVFTVEGLPRRVKPETRTRYFRKLVLEEGMPEFYHKRGSKIVFRPTPDQVYTVGLDYFKNLTPMVAQADVSLFHEDWDEAIFVGALYRGFRHFGEFDRYQNVRNDFLGLVRSRQTEFDLEEFPEGGISPIGPDDTELEESI